ncbi:rhodanese-like domain-containing protein [Streptomyces sannanensis]|uniref:Rhodanese-like domain-containing protein n=1 Tax=Streptomyces sannanensis TaxID=285536 RepID=A0ABP6SM62_9ACTN
MTASLTVEQLHTRMERVTVIDVRSPGEYAAGHIPGAHNIPLDQLQRALPTLRAAVAAGSTFAVVCASGARSASACGQLATAGIPASTLVGGTTAWAQAGFGIDRPAGGARAVWAMDRQVRLAAGTLVLLGLLADLLVPGARWFSAAIGAGLVFSALTNTCAMGMLISRLPHNRPRTGARDLTETLSAIAP